MDHMAVNVEASDNGDAHQGAEALVDNIKSNIGISVEVNVGVQNSVPRSQGKAVRLSISAARYGKARSDRRSSEGPAYVASLY